MTEPAKIAKHASEGGHWYDRDGNQIAEVTGAKGQPLKPTLRHARVHGWAPGVTTIIGQARAHQLERWKTRQAVISALTLPRGANESDDAFLSRVEADGREQAKAAAERGTEIHAAIQRYGERHREPGFPFSAYWSPWIDAIRSELERYNCDPDEPWHSEIGCAHSAGYGTKADLVCDGWLVDFKTKDVIDGRTKTYDEHDMQLAATAHAVRMSTDHKVERCAIVFLTREAPVEARLVEVDTPALERGWLSFNALLSYWKSKNRHEPWQRTFTERTTT